MSTQYKVIVGDSGVEQLRVPKTGVESYLAPVTLDALGADSVTNGDFAVGTGWTLGTGVTISGGTATWDASQVADSDLENDGNAPVASSQYEIVFDVISEGRGE